MRNILVLGLGIGLTMLTGCQPVVPPIAGPFEGVAVSPEAAARCGSVTWTDSGWKWNTDRSLPGYSLWKLEGGQWKVAAELVAGRQITLGEGSYRLEHPGMAVPTLDSTFTCTRTGEVLKAAYTFPNTSGSASAVLYVKDNQFFGQWQAFLPPA